MKKTEPFIQIARCEFHKTLLVSLLTINDKGVPGNADKDNRTSVAIANGIAQRLKAEMGVRAVAQTSGTQFEDLIARFVRETFLKLPHLRPGRWEVRQVTGRNRTEIARYAQYSHLVALQELAAKNAALAAVLGNDYAISPDVVVTRALESDASINAPEFLVDASVAKRADLREGEGKQPLLHASISTKWTLRSDRAQNARSEALNFIRNRKGRQPHIVVVTGEPTPSRLSSLALGTGDIDCVYHFALDELIESVKDLHNSEAEDMLSIMVDGKRLKDIADLPLDLAV
ncbi:Type-2 restriction enzyme NgoMIV [Georgfuchsia toluolica]|uniref:Type-2 restriction enzyme NgoMIV n=1 Tax=Georgfuchsia toluolica TaxID=424218 RepID=A0A916J687_9PROT|nr:NgoMIV family type II restriction endonuclease [Georgfuchsia toluolica]CAG4884675.1 Type-2 restriction enzyme NgoMIV [Georgfuchsia toluolica]